MCRKNASISLFNQTIGLIFPSKAPLEISDLEKDPAKKHYSYNSLKEIISINGNHKYYFFLGSDISLNFNEWYKYLDLLNLVNVVFVSRPKFKFSPNFIDTKIYSRKLNYKGMLIYYNNITKMKIIRLSLKKEINISSKELRLMLKSFDEKKVKRFLSNQVYDYIIKNKFFSLFIRQRKWKFNISP